MMQGEGREGAWERGGPPIKHQCRLPCGHRREIVLEGLRFEACELAGSAGRWVGSGVVADPVGWERRPVCGVCIHTGLGQQVLSPGHQATSSPVAVHILKCGPG